MNPAFSVIFLTTLTGVGQGLFLAIYGAELGARWGVIATPDRDGFFFLGSVLVVVFAGLGLVASFFHLGRPERAWRSAAMWRTSWLSREVIALPAFMAASALYGLAHYLDWQATLFIGLVASALCLALFVCTGMIYACIRFLQEWSSPLTVVNYFVLGVASGLTLAAAFSVFAAPDLTRGYAIIALVMTFVGLCTRSMALVRNARLRPKSTVQTAIGIRHPRITQKSEGFMGGSFNTREFFHGKSRSFLRHVKRGFLLTAFVIPLLLLSAASVEVAALWLVPTFVIQFVGLLAERWFFFAEANHPQNLYYQAIS
jgi:sulfite dehydrogenase (quinone) subunit SoeC